MQAGHTRCEQKHPQQGERMDQVIGLLGGKLAVERLGAIVGKEKVGMRALGQVEEGEVVNLPLPLPPRSLQAEETRPPQPLFSSSGGE